MDLIEQLDAGEQSVRRKTEHVPKVALVLGSGLGSLADEIESRCIVPYEAIDGMAAPGVSGHAGKPRSRHPRRKRGGLRCRVATTSTKGEAPTRWCLVFG